MRWTAIRLAGATAGVLLICAPGPATAQQSARFVVERITLASATGAPASARFVSVAVVAQSEVSGAASRCNDGFASAFGFWSVAGRPRVPLRLRLVADAVDTSSVGLEWTGSNPDFGVFRSISPQDVTDPANLLLQTPACQHTDIEAAGPGILFYKVQPLP